MVKIGKAKVWEATALKEEGVFTVEETVEEEEATDGAMAAAAVTGGKRAREEDCGDCEAHCKC